MTETFPGIGAILALALVAGWSTAAAEPSRAGLAQRGRVLVERHCAACHALGATGESPNPQAPPFRRLHERYDVEALGEGLAEGFFVGHGPMPEWRFEPADVSAILAYLKSLQAQSGARPTTEGPSR